MCFGIPYTVPPAYCVRTPSAVDALCFSSQHLSLVSYNFTGTFTHFALAWHEPPAQLLVQFEGGTSLDPISPHSAADVETPKLLLSLAMQEEKCTQRIPKTLIYYLLKNPKKEISNPLITLKGKSVFLF